MRCFVHVCFVESHDQVPISDVEDEADRVPISDVVEYQETSKPSALATNIQEPIAVTNKTSLD